MSAAVVQLVASGESNTNNTTVTGTITNVPTVGNHMVLIERHVTSRTLNSIGDTVSTWQVDRNNTNLMSLASAKVTGDLTGVTFTLTFSGNTIGKSFEIWEVSGLDPTTWFGSGGDAVRTSQGTARNFGSNIITPGAVGDLIIAGWSATVSAESSLTAASGYTNLPGATASGYFNTAAGNWLEGVWRAAASTSAQEPTATGGSSPSAYRAITGTYIAAATAGTTPLRTLMGVGT
jgi:flagellar capping protein FliD